MIRKMVLFATLALGVAACTPASNPPTTSDGRIGKVYKINRSDVGKLQFRMLDSVNALRSSSGSNPLKLDASLNAAAATHARDMSTQNRPWHFGSDGSSP
ncbi:MAG: CAP domain-containing protein, partial [Hyphomicrobiales bacterium]